MSDDVQGPSRGTPQFAEHLSVLRARAERLLREERTGHTLQATALVNEAYLRLRQHEVTDEHFVATVVAKMRHILIDHARARGAKRRPPMSRAPLAEEASGSHDDEDLPIIRDALLELQETSPRLALTVSYRYMGMSQTEIAQQMGLSLATVERDWAFARAWLESRL